MNIKKIPYGDSDYGKIIKSNMYYVDKTKYGYQHKAGLFILAPIGVTYL